MEIPSEFDDIRPYKPEELPQVFEELLADPTFHAVITYVMPHMPYDAFAARLRQCKSSLEVQEVFVKPFLEDMLSKCSDGISLDDADMADKTVPHTFISNHRDIVLDSALLSVELLNGGYHNTVEIAIGDNLLIYPWIKQLVRVDKSFIVQRGTSMREKLLTSARLGRYMNFAITQKHENVWIAQREGRSKDSSDHTQEAILKMMCMGGEGTPAQRLTALNIIPTAISYEYDPCDYLKAQEFQQKRDDANFRKSQADDLLSMRTGIFGHKGRIHFSFAPILNDFLSTLPPDTPKTDFYRLAAEHIDYGIHSHYRLYPGNYVAADILRGSSAFTDHYTADEMQHFRTYLDAQMAKITIPNPDRPFLLERMLTMYANPLFNLLDTHKKQNP
jgi:hypothetical protein